MFLSAVVLVLQEMLEAALLISVMLAFTFLFQQLWATSFNLSHRWAYYSCALGFVGAALFAYYTPTISIWFDYVGQEIVNAVIHSVSFLMIMAIAFIAPLASLDKNSRLRSNLIGSCMIGVVFFSIVREGSEVMLYIQGITSEPENVSPVFLGGLLGAGIGFSTGVLLYYALVSLNRILAFRVGLVLLCLIAGNMAAQVAQLLNQADWLPYTPALWDSSSVISESSVFGHLLYALVGYEATPSAAQVICYSSGIIAIAASPLRAKLWKKETMAALHTKGVLR